MLYTGKKKISGKSQGTFLLELELEPEPEQKNLVPKKTDRLNNTGHDDCKKILVHRYRLFLTEKIVCFIFKEISEHRWKILSRAEPPS